MAIGEGQNQEAEKDVEKDIHNSSKGEEEKEGKKMTGPKVVIRNIAKSVDMVVHRIVYRRVHSVRKKKEIS